MFSEYEHLLFEPNEDKGPDLTYQKQIDQINKFFSWSIIALKMSDYNPIIYKNINNMKLQDVFDYLVINKQNAKIEEYKNSKNIIAI